MGLIIGFTKASCRIGRAACGDAVAAAAAAAGGDGDDDDAVGALILLAWDKYCCFHVSVTEGFLGTVVVVAVAPVNDSGAAGANVGSPTGMTVPALVVASGSGNSVLIL